MTTRHIFLIFYLLTSTVFSQVAYKTIRDTSLKVNDIILATKIIFAPGGTSWTYKYFTDSVDLIADFLNKYPKIKIALESHTDTRGNSQANMQLSQSRADNIKDYLTTIKSINPDRIIAKGYGMTQPIIPIKKINSVMTKKEKEKMHQTNYRTELKILSID